MIYIMVCNLDMYMISINWDVFIFNINLTGTLTVGLLLIIYSMLNIELGNMVEINNILFWYWFYKM